MGSWVPVLADENVSRVFRSVMHGTKYASLRACGLLVRPRAGDRPRGPNQRHVTSDPRSDVNAMDSIS